MKHTLLLFLVLISCFSFGQTHRFIYEVEYKPDSTETNLKKDFYHLDINPAETFYYGRIYFVLDSIMKSGAEMNFESAPVLTNITTHQKGSRKFTEFVFEEYEMYKYDVEATQKWTLLNEKKKIDKFEVQKAKCNWGGRNWTAWFTNEIPFQEGPYMLKGLPGMILEAEDEKGNYSFKVVRSENFEETQPTTTYFGMFSKNAIPVTFPQYVKMKLNRYKDPLSFMQNRTDGMENSEGVFLNDGTMVTKDNKREVQLRQQKMMKKYNNPIDLTRIVTFP